MRRGSKGGENCPARSGNCYIDVLLLVEDANSSENCGGFATVLRTCRAKLFANIKILSSDCDSFRTELADSLPKCRQDI